MNSQVIGDDDADTSAESLDPEEVTTCLTALRNDLAALEDRLEYVVEPAGDERDDRIAELEAAVGDLRERVQATEDRLDEYARVDEPAESTPHRRAAALREAMLRAVADESSDSRARRDGIKWHWRQVKTALVGMGHEGFSKPVYHTAMDDAVAFEGFSMATTTMVIDDHGTTREVKAIALSPADLPPGTLRNQLTTGGRGEGGQSDSQPTTEVTGTREE